MGKQKGNTAVIVLAWMAFFLAAGGGWIANIVKLVGMNFDHITGMLVGRAIGIFVAPLGAVLGYL